MWESPCVDSERLTPLKAKYESMMSHGSQKAQPVLNAFISYTEILV